MRRSILDNLLRAGVSLLCRRSSAQVVALTSLVVATNTLAETASPITPVVLNAASTGCTHAAKIEPTNTDVDAFRCLSADDQARWWRTRVDNHALLALTDAQLLALMDAMKPEAFVDYAKSDMVQDNDYEYGMFRQERVGGRWADRSDHMTIRYQDSPRKVYAKWLPDGAHAGQEILYDETTDPDRIYGHAGGLFRIVSAKIAIDGPFARAQSRHSVRDLGLQFIARTVDHDARSFRDEGLTPKPTHIEILNTQGKRMLSWTWTAPSGPPAHYAQRVRLLFDLQHPWPSGEVAWDERGRLLEVIRFEDVTPRHWSDATFDPHNPEYGFH